MHGRDVHADLFEDAALHDRHRAAAALRTVVGWPRPFFAREPARLDLRRSGILVLDRFEGCAQPVAQFSKPCACPVFLLFRRNHVSPWPDHAGNPLICRNASPRTIAPACATLSERRPGFKGMRTLASTPSCTKSGTPALSRPSKSVSE